MFLLPDNSVTTAILSKQHPTQQNATMIVQHCLIIGLQLLGHSFLRRKKKAITTPIVPIFYVFCQTVKSEEGEGEHL